MDAGGSRLSAEELLDRQEAEDLAAAISASLADLSLGHSGAEEGSGPGGAPSAGATGTAAGAGGAGTASTSGASAPGAAEPESEPTPDAAAPAGGLHIQAGGDVILAIDVRGCCHRRCRRAAAASRAGRSPPPRAAADAARPGSCRTSAAGPSPQEPPAEGPGGDWAYAVWAIAGAQHLRGIHVGSLRAWRALAPQLPGGRYSYPACRLRRYDNEQLAIAGYEAEAGRHAAPTPPRVFYY